MVALNDDVSRFGECKIRERCELERLLDGIIRVAVQFEIPLRRPQFVLGDHRPIEPMLDMRPIDDDARGVPFVGPFRDAADGRIEAIHGTGRRHDVTAVRRERILSQLVLGRAPIGARLRFGGAIENAGVTARGDLPVDAQFKVGELLSRDDVFGGARLTERAVDHLPLGGHLRHLIAAPCTHVRPVEQQSPPRRLLGDR